MNKTLRTILSDSYGPEGAKAMAAEAGRWHRHPNGKGWVRDDAEVDPAAFLGPETVTHGPRTHIGPQTRAEGESVLGAAVTTKGKTHIDSATLSGASPKNLGKEIGLRPVVIADSFVSHAQVTRSSLWESAVSQGQVDNSFLERSQGNGLDLSIADSRLVGARVENSVVSRSHLAENSLVKEAFVDQTRVAEGYMVENIEMLRGEAISYQNPSQHAALKNLHKEGAIEPYTFQRSGKNTIAQDSAEHVR